MMCCMSDEEKLNKATHNRIEEEIKRNRKDAAREVKLLLLGTGESGKSTFVKQMNILHGSGYSDNAKRQFIQLVYQNIFLAMQSMIKAMDVLKIPYDNENHSELADMVISIANETVTSLKEPYLSAIKTLWSDIGIQECYERRREYQLADSAK